MHLIAAPYRTKEQSSMNRRLLMDTKLFLKSLPMPIERFSFLSKLFFGLPDLFLSFSLFSPSECFSNGVAWCLSNAKLITSRSKRIILLLPLLEHKKSYDESLKKMISTIGCDIDTTRNFIIITNRNPFNIVTPTPSISIDITDSKPWESFCLFGSLTRLASKERIFSSKYASGFGSPLFKQDLNILEGTSPGRHKESAFDVLSFQVQLCPSMILQFHHFDREIQKRFDSIFMETMESKPGAMPFSDVLKSRKDFEESFNSNPTNFKLANESDIRQIWK